MKQYLVAICRPDDYDPSVESEAMSRKIDAPQRGDGGCRCREVRRRPLPGQQRLTTHDSGPVWFAKPSP
jgi:hypothetical protein